MIRSSIPPALALLMLLIAGSAAAQAVHPTEQSYGPYARPAAGYEPAMAVSRNAVLLAWSEFVEVGRPPQIRFGLLDFHGRLVSAITTLDTESGATSPVVTTDGTSFRVTYLEGAQLLAVDVDSRGTVTVAPRRWPNADDGTPVMRWEPPHEVCGIARPCGLYAFWTLHWSFAGRSGSYLDLRREDVGPAVAGGSANHFALAWNTAEGVRYLDSPVGTQPAAAALIPASVLVWERPAVDCDDTHCLFAFATPARQIYAVLIDSAQPYIQVPVAIETASRVESPQVHLLQQGRFLVSYVSAADDPAHRFAGRIVTTAALPRRRAVR